jgi:hypothetical protein
MDVYRSGGSVRGAMVPPVIFHDLLTWGEKEPTIFVMAGMLLTVIIIGAAAESVYRRYSLNDDENNQGRFADARPDVTISIVLALGNLH